MTEQPVWYLSRSGKQSGPLSHDELVRRAARGEILTDDLVWRPGFTSWTPASSVPGLLTPPHPSPHLAEMISLMAAPARPPGFLGLWRLWRGEKPLWEAFWIYFWTGSFLASILGLMVAAAVQYVVEYVILRQPIGGVGALFLYAPFSLLAPTLYQVFAGIGTWRSASSRRVTGILARICISITFAVLLLVFGSLLYAQFAERG